MLFEFFEKTKKEMDFRRKRIVKSEPKVISEVYPHDLQLYKIPPVGEISLEEFENLAIERLQGIVPFQ